MPRFCEVQRRYGRFLAPMVREVLQKQPTLWDPGTRKLAQESRVSQTWGRSCQSKPLSPPGGLGWKRRCLESAANQDEDHVSIDCSGWLCDSERAASSGIKPCALVRRDRDENADLLPKLVRVTVWPSWYWPSSRAIMP